MTGPLPSAPTGAAPPATPRHRGVFWLAAVVATFALVGGGYTAIAGYLRDDRPSDVAVDYFKAVARGDAARALSYGTVPTGDRRFLTAEVLADQLTVSRIANIEVLSVTRTDRTATVALSYQLREPGPVALSTQVVTDSVRLVQTGRHWRLEASAVSTKVSLAQAAKRATFAGAAVPTGSVLLFPGALPVTFDTPNLELARAGSIVRFDRSVNTDLLVEASAAGIGAARDVVVTALKACLAATSADPFCPVPGGRSSTNRAVPGSLRGTLDSKAADSLAITVSPDGDGVLMVAGNISVDGEYLALNYANIATETKDAAIKVAIAAHCYASSPTQVTWKTS